MLVWAGENKGSVRVDRWPDAPRAFKTIAIHTHNFEGIVRIEGTIEEEPSDNDWFEITTEEFERPLLRDSHIQNRIHQSRDRTIWMRAIIETQFGRVDRVLVL